MLLGGANQPNEWGAQAQHRADAYQPPLRRPDSLGQALQVTIGPREETLPHAWGAPGSGAPEATRTRSSMVALLVRLSRIASAFENWCGKRVG
jgi:hypothetical protein